MKQDSGHNIENANVTTVDESNMLTKYIVGVMSKDNKEWICNACQSAISNA